MKNEKFAALSARIEKEYGNTAGITISQGGTLFYESYFNGCDADTKIHIYSVTKSIVSALMGIALEKGYITSLDQKVVDFFPEYKKEKALQMITLRHLLTMTVPYKRMLNPYPKYFASPDWVKFSLEAIGGRGRVGEFTYAPLIGPDILSGILVKATGQSVLDFAQENLFEPLGDGGNMIYVNPQKQLVVSMTGLFVPKAKDRLALIQQEIEVLF